ncbi:MAG: hypothetical protein ACRDH5_16710 [bacterium]
MAKKVAALVIGVVIAGAAALLLGGSEEVSSWSTLKFLSRLLA